VGELARRTGLTVRTLHHYDEIGLLRPSLHTEAGYRLYTGRDIARLQQVLSLRQLGLSLEEIRNCLDQPGFSPLEVIDLHLARLHEQIASQRRLCERLEAIAARLRTSGEVSADEFLRTIEEMTMIENYFTPEQFASIQQRRDELGAERLRQEEAEWAEVIALIRAQMERGTDPGDAQVQALAQRWRRLMDESGLGDPAMKQSVKRLWEEQGDNIVAQYGPALDSRPIWGYLDKALAAGTGSTGTQTRAVADVRPSQQP
jgi:DNA-binding transcriptional MerR regulator